MSVPGGIDGLRIVPAQSEDLARYIDLMEEIAEWLEERGIKQWRIGSFRRSIDYYTGSIERQEVYLAFIQDHLAGTLRILLREPIVWPEVADEDGVYVHSLAVRRLWAGRGLGMRMLEWAEKQAELMGRSHVRLDCVADNEFLPLYYERVGFRERGEIDANYPEPVGTLRLLRFEKRVGAA
jgi:GNAT superfamily N-acetyltransferase